MISSYANRLLSEEACAATPQPTADGSFWMSWHSFYTSFNRLHVCWTPQGRCAGEEGAGEGRAGGDSARGGRVEGGKPLLRVDAVVRYVRECVSLFCRRI